MRVLAATIMLVLFASFPARAANELQGQPFSEVVETGEKHGVKVEKLSAADTATMDEAVPNRPKPSAIYLLTLGSSVIIALVQDGVVIFSTDPIELAKINKILSRSEA
jgi:hypothetical protein